MTAPSARFPSSSLYSFLLLLPPFSLLFLLLLEPIVVSAVVPNCTIAYDPSLEALIANLNMDIRYDASTYRASTLHDRSPTTDRLELREFVPATSILNEYNVRPYAIAWTSLCVALGVGHPAGYSLTLPEIAHLALAPKTFLPVFRAPAKSGVFGALFESLRLQGFLTAPELSLGTAGSSSSTLYTPVAYDNTTEAKNYLTSDSRYATAVAFVSTLDARRHGLKCALVEYSAHVVMSPILDEVSYELYPPSMEYISPYNESIMTALYQAPNGAVPTRFYPLVGPLVVLLPRNGLEYYTSECSGPWARAGAVLSFAEGLFKTERTDLIFKRFGIAPLRPSTWYNTRSTLQNDNPTPDSSVSVTVFSSLITLRVILVLLFKSWSALPTSSSRYFLNFTELSSPEKALVTVSATVPTTAVVESAGRISFPLLSYPMTVLHNVPGVQTLYLTSCVLLDIFSERIKYWDDIEIQELNPASSMPALQISIILHDSEEEMSILTKSLLRISKECGRNVTSMPWTLGTSAVPRDSVTKVVDEKSGSISCALLLNDDRRTDLVTSMTKSTVFLSASGSMQADPLQTTINLSNIYDAGIERYATPALQQGIGANTTR
eukprot:PhM_4_TR4004/c0_g1_i1/m.102907